MQQAFRLLFLVLVLCVPIAMPSAQQSEVHTNIPLPHGTWTATHSLESGLKLPGSPAEIVSNRGDGDQGLLVSITQMANRSDKAIASVRFGWFVYSVKEPQRILANGTSAVIGLERFKPGALIRIDYPAVRFAEAIEPYVQGGSLAGDYNIEVSVIETQFADGSKWNQDLSGLGLPKPRPN